MDRAETRHKYDWEYWYTIIALLFLCNAISPPLFDLLGSHSEDYGESNPFNLVFSSVIYMIAGLIVLRSPSGAVNLLKQNPFIIVLLLLPLISVLWSVDRGTTIRRALAYSLTGVFCIYLANRLSPEVFLKRLMFVVLIAGVGSVLYAVAFPRFGITPGGMNGGSWRGLFGQKNGLGRICSIAIIVAYFVKPANRAERFYRYLTIAIFLPLLVLSQSRTNWLITAGLFGFVPLLNVMRYKKLALSIRFMIVLSFAVSFALIVIFGTEAILAAIGRDDSFSGRETLWRGVTAIVNEHYPVLGAGYGAFWTDRGGVNELSSYVFWSDKPDQAHSGYLNVRADLGALGFYVLIAFIVITSIRMLFCIVRQPNRTAWPAFACLVFFFVMNNITETAAFKHSDITWAIMLIADFYAVNQQKSVIERSKGYVVYGNDALKRMGALGSTAERPSPSITRGVTSQA